MSRKGRKFVISFRRDTAGQERYRSLTTSFFRDATGFFLVFDLTKESSFLNVRHWIEEVQANASMENIALILVGNKSDRENERIIRKSQAMELAQQYQLDYIETSALENLNVDEAVQLLLKSVVDHLETNDSFPEPNPPISRTSIESVMLDRMDHRSTRKPLDFFCCNY